MTSEGNTYSTEGGQHRLLSVLVVSLQRLMTAFNKGPWLPYEKLTVARGDSSSSC